MNIKDLNEMTLEELYQMHEEKKYRYLICDGRIMWVHEEEK